MPWKNHFWFLKEEPFSQRFFMEPFSQKWYFYNQNRVKKKQVAAGLNINQTIFIFNPTMG